MNYAVTYVGRGKYEEQGVLGMIRISSLFNS